MIIRTKEKLAPMVNSIFAERIHSGIARRLASGAVWSFAGSVAMRVATIVASIVVARVLGRENYGKYAAVISTVGMFQVFAGLGLGVSVTKLVAERKGLRDGRVGRTIGLALISSAVAGAGVGALVFVFANELAVQAFGDGGLVPLLRISSLSLLFSALNGAQQGVLVGFEAFKTRARLDAISGIATLSLTLGMTLAVGLDGTVWASVISGGVACLISRVALAREAKRHGIVVAYVGSSAEWPDMWKLGVPTMLSAVMVAPVNWLCSALLVRSSENGFAELGVFGAANQWFFALMFVPSLVGGVTLPIMSERLAAKDSEAVYGVLRISTLANACIAGPVALIVSISAPWVMPLYGHGFAGQSAVLVVSVLTAAVLALIAPVGYVLVAVGKTWTAFAMNSAWAALFVVGTLILRSRGAQGLAEARLIAYLLHSVWTVLFAFWFLRANRMSRNGTGTELMEQKASSSLLGGE